MMGAIVEKGKIEEILDDYKITDNSDITIVTVASHTAQQIIRGAKKKGFKTLLIGKEKEKPIYYGFKECVPGDYKTVDDYKEILEPGFQEMLREMQAIVIPHGSFVAYIGADELAAKFEVPMFGNRKTLGWESSRDKQRKWLHDFAGIKMPRQYNSIDEIPFGADDAPKLFLVKYPGAPGGKGFFKFETKDEFKDMRAIAKDRGELKEADVGKVVIQEYVQGNRYYLHFFSTPFFDKGLKVKGGYLELLSADRRDEAADELHRLGLDHKDLRKLGIIPDYEVKGNIPIILREKFVATAFELGRRTVESSIEVMGGIPGPFCLETVVGKDGEFFCFEISARIVAGTNLYTDLCPHPYTVNTWGVGMSHGDRIALEIEAGIKKARLNEVIY